MTIDAQQCGGDIAPMVITPGCSLRFESARVSAVPKYVAIAFSLHCTLISKDTTCSDLSYTRSSAYII